MLDPEEATAQLHDIINKFCKLEDRGAVGLDAGASALRDELFDEIRAVAEEVSLTHLPTLSGIACKATCLAFILEEPTSDLAGALARSLADDVLAMSCRSSQPDELPETHLRDSRAP